MASIVESRIHTHLCVALSIGAFVNKNFNIGVRNGLLDDKHRLAMGSAVWLYLWLIDHQTKSSSKVLGGKPIRAADVQDTYPSIDEKTYRRWLTILTNFNYIEARRTPYGYVIIVTKAKKWELTDRTKMSDHSTKRPDKNVRSKRTKMSDLSDKNVRSNKDNTIDNTVNNTIKEEKKVNPETINQSLITHQTKPTKRDGNIDELVEFFEQSFDLKLKRMKFQRIAASNLIKRYTKASVLKAIEAAAIARPERYSPQILSLEDLWSKWDKLAAFYKRNEPKSTHIDLDNIV